MFVAHRQTPLISRLLNQRQGESTLLPVHVLLSSCTPLPSLCDSFINLRVVSLPAYNVCRSPADAPYFTALESMTGGIHVIACVNYFSTVAPPNPHFVILSLIYGWCHCLHIMFVVHRQKAPNSNFKNQRQGEIV
jgi:hypothetical protein